MNDEEKKALNRLVANWELEVPSSLIDPCVVGPIPECYTKHHPIDLGDILENLPQTAAAAGITLTKTELTQLRTIREKWLVIRTKLTPYYRR